MNKIVLVSNLKGGTGKTSICELLAIYAVEKGLPTMVLDADNNWMFMKTAKMIFLNIRKQIRFLTLVH